MLGDRHLHMFYSIIWLENTANTGWIELPDMTPDVYGQKFDEFSKEGYRVADIECYARDNKLTYAAIWEINQPGRGWAALRQTSSLSLRNNWHKYTDQGMCIIDIEVFPATSGGGKSICGGLARERRPIRLVGARAG